MTVGRLIVNADDLGLTEGHNRAIIEAHNHGIVTSTSLLACGLAFNDAVERVRSTPTLGVGVHLTLLEGSPVSPVAQIPDLVGEQGQFGLSYVELFRRLALRQVRLEQVYREWQAQIQKVMARGVHVTHLDSHKHIHMYPQLLQVMLALADEFNVRRMRLSRPLHPFLSVKSMILWMLSIGAQRRAGRVGVGTPDVLLGLEASGRITAERLLAMFRRPWQGTYELMIHPAYPGNALESLLREGYRWIAQYEFEDEQMALCDPIVRDHLEDINIQCIHYGAL
jgi:hopanoid biosynthesis associated protein HpnK